MTSARSWTCSAPTSCSPTSCPASPTTRAPPRSATGRIFGNSGPIVPLATWTPGEVGIQHAAGQRVARTLAERGCAVPEEWYVASDHPKRGLVLKTYASPPVETVAWLARAAAVLCPIPITEPWRARGQDPLTAPPTTAAAEAAAVAVAVAQR